MRDDYGDVWWGRPHTRLTMRCRWQAGTGRVAAGLLALPSPAHHSVATLLLAMAEPQPKVLKQLSTMLPCSSTLIWSFITSPHAGAPTSPVPTLGSVLSKLPTLRGFS